MNGGLVKKIQYNIDTLNKDRVKEYHGSNHARDNLPNIITNRTLKFIEKAANSKKLPFLAVLPARMAPRRRPCSSNTSSTTSRWTEAAAAASNKFLLAVNDLPFTFFLSFILEFFFNVLSKFDSL